MPISPIWNYWENALSLSCKVLEDHSLSLSSSFSCEILQDQRHKSCGVFDVCPRTDSSILQAWSRLHNKDTMHVQLFRSGYFRNRFPPADGASEMGVPNFYTPHFHVIGCMYENDRWQEDDVSLFWPLQFTISAIIWAAQDTEWAAGWSILKHEHPSC